jgi:osmoprotectant transport system ATP-binding protein
MIGSALTVELVGASKRYGPTEVLRPTTLRLQPGINVLLGQSGSGKSTILRLIAGLVRPDAGEVRIDGRPIVSETLPSFRRQMGYVIQEGGLFPHLTAGANVTLAAEYAGVDRAAIARRLKELSDLARLPAEALKRFPTQLSGGQRQRVSLMRALMLEPKLLLLDEPLGALDPMIRADLRADLLAIFRLLKNTVILVTHDLSEASYFADQVVMLRDGRVVQQGRLKDLVDSPAEPFVSAFIRAQSSFAPALAAR